MSGINIPNNIVFNPGEGDFGPSRQISREQNTIENAGAALGADYTSAINRAMEIEDTQLRAVEEAQKAIADNRIITRENIVDAARNILKFGI